METTLPGEIPMLVHLWAASSREVRVLGSKPAWELQDIVILKSFYRKPHNLSRPEWSFKTHREKTITFSFPGAARSTRFSDFSSLYDYIPTNIYQWHIHYLDRGTDALLHNIVDWHPKKLERLAPVLLSHSGVDWPSVLQAAQNAAIANPIATSPRKRRPSLVRRVLSSLFKKKPKPVAA